MNKKNNVQWLTIDPSVISQMENITHIFIADGSYKYNEKNVSELLTSYGWEITQKLDKTQFFLRILCFEKLKNLIRPLIKNPTIPGKFTMQMYVVNENASTAR